MVKITDKFECTGCFACFSVCPVNCITMLQDEEGFFYPSVDGEKCLQCGLCEKICPIITPIDLRAEENKVYICQNKSDKIRLDSTSGGVFSALAQYVIDRNGIVFGAEFGEKLVIQHGECKESSGISRFRGSKYVQSYIGNTYKKVKKYLDDNKWVLFSGVPCQVAGLYSYLGKKYEKLILMDVVCYSISSPGVWNKYLEYISQINKVAIESISRVKFRDKTKYGYDYTLMTFWDKEGKIVLSEGPESNPMLRSFVSNTSTRPSCYDCRFKGTNRVSDFTLWDCYNMYQYNKTLDDDMGTSHMMIHTKKAFDMLTSLKEYLDFYEVDINKAVASEPAMTDSAKASNERTAFFDEYQAGKNVFELFFQYTLKVKAEHLLRQSLSKIGIYKYIKRLLRG